MSEKVKAQNVDEGFYAMTSYTSKVLILGANGRFGAAASRAFAQAGWQVFAQARRPLQGLPETIKYVDVDVMQTEALCRAASGMDVIVDAMNPPYTQWEAHAIPLANQALRAAKSSGSLLMFPGNVYNFGTMLPADLRLDTPQIGDHAKARIRIAIEKQLQEAALEGVRSVVVRAGDFFGGDRRGVWFDSVMVKSLAKGKFVYPGGPDITHSWAYLPDLAQTFVLLAEHHVEFKGAETFHFPGYSVTGKEFQKALESACGHPLKMASAPWGIMRLVSPFNRMFREILTMRYLWQRPHSLIDERLEVQLGRAVPHTPLPKALEQALKDLGM